MSQMALKMMNRPAAKAKAAKDGVAEPEDIDNDPEDRPVPTASSELRSRDWLLI